jgi:DNA-directed RNA polymerase subunit M/transcription elongation factor TFIIS
MPQVVQCHHCQKRFAAADRLAGKRVACGSCGKAIEVPQSPLADLLDDEIQVQPEEEVVMAKVARPQGPACLKCQSELIPGKRFCLACGHNNFNADAAIADGLAESKKERDRASGQDDIAVRAARIATFGLFGFLRG